MSIETDANAAYADSVPVSKEAVRDLWGRVNDYLNNRFICSWGLETQPRIDVVNNVVRYGRMTVSRNGEAYKDLDPVDYGLTSFSLPYSPKNSNTQFFHYINVLDIDTAINPVKSLSGASVPELTENIVPLGISLDATYYCFWSSSPERNDEVLPVRVIAAQNPIIVDRRGRLGGGAAVYVPRNMYVNADGRGYIFNGVLGTASTELSTHVKFALTGTNPAGTQSVYLNAEQNTLVLATNPVQPLGDQRGFIPIVTVWSTSHTAYYGLQCLDADDYDYREMRNRLWDRVISTNKPIIWDKANYYGGGLDAVYVPRWIYIQEAERQLNRLPANITNAECAEISGYLKLTGVGTSNVHAIVFDASTDTFSLRTSAGGIPLDVGKMDDIFVLATIWNGAWNGSEYIDTNSGIVENQTAYGKDDIEDMPHLFGSTTIQPVTNAGLLALGFTKGAADITGANRPYFGDNFKKYIRGGWLHIKFWVQTDTSDNFGTPRVFLWQGASGPNISYSGAVTQVKKLSSFAAQYELRIRTPTSTDCQLFLVGTDTQSTSVRTVITGVQYHLSQNQTFNILPDDYPVASAVVLDASLEARDARNLALARSYADRVIAHVQKPTADYNVKFVTGQSLAQGQQTQFALSQTALYGNKMLGGNVLPSQTDGADYPTYAPGDSWQNMIAVPVDNGAIYTNATAPDLAYGEPWNLGWLNASKFLFNQMQIKLNDARTFGTFNVAVSGKTIEQLSKINTQDATNRFARLTDALNIAVAASGASSVVVTSVAFGQGEFDYKTDAGSVNRTRALYKAALNTYFSDIKTEVLARCPDQERGCAFFTYATSASYAVDTDANGVPDLFVAMAQLELSNTRDDVWMVGPCYPYIDKGGHLTANGSRWYANQLAKVEHRVQHLGRDWSPLQPIKVELAGSIILIDFHVPEPPLVWDEAYVIRTGTLYANRGFRVIDLDNANATVTIGTVEIVGGTIVRITLSGTHSQNLAVYYADKTVHNGNGNLRDSDPMIAHDLYLYDAAYMPASDNIEELVNKPYPLHNWCVPFFYPVGFTL